MVHQAIHEGADFNAATLSRCLHGQEHGDAWMSLPPSPSRRVELLPAMITTLDAREGLQSDRRLHLYRRRRVARTMARETAYLEVVGSGPGRSGEVHAGNGRASLGTLADGRLIMILRGSNDWIRACRGINGCRTRVTAGSAGPNPSRGHTAPETHSSLPALARKSQSIETENCTGWVILTRRIHEATGRDIRSMQAKWTGAADFWFRKALFLLTTATG